VPAGVEVVAAGLTNPRGFAWGPDGSLYLALAGSGGETRFEIAEGFTLELGLSSSVVTVADGCATPVAPGLVSAHWVEPGWVWGTMDVAFLDDELYVLVSGAGPTWLSPTSFSGVFRLNDDGTMTLVADVTTWLPEHPPAFTPPDYNADGSLFDLEAAGDALLVSEAVGGQLLRVTPEGEISTLVDLSEGHLVPTGIAVDAEGNAYVGFETSPPYPDGASKVVKVTPDGTVSDEWTGLTAVTDVAIGPDGALYAVEMATGNLDEEPFLNPASGRVVRQNGPDGVDEVLTDIAYPVNLGFDADGALYVTYPAFARNAGENQGALLRIDPTAATPISLAEVGELPPTCQDGGPPASGETIVEATPTTTDEG
jgi:sugar lactone lactonase YvrE